MHGLTSCSLMRGLRRHEIINIGRIRKLPNDKRKLVVTRTVISLAHFCRKMQLPQRTKNTAYLIIHSGFLMPIYQRDWVANVGFLSYNPLPPSVDMWPNICSKKPCQKIGLRNGSVYGIRKIGQSSLLMTQFLWLYYDHTKIGMHPRSTRLSLDVRRLWIMKLHFTT